MSTANGKRGLVLGSVWVRAHGFIRADQITSGVPVMPRFGYPHKPELVEPTIRRHILYFDDIEVPNNDLWPAEIPEIQLLVEQGVVQLHVALLDKKFAVSMAATLSLVHAANTYIFKFLDDAAPGQWAFTPLAPEVDLFWPPENLLDAQAIEIDLYGMLPVPAPEVEYGDILDFRSRRRPELLQLRSYLDELYVDVIDSKDVPRAKTVAINKIEKALSDLQAVLHQGLIRTIYENVKVSVIVGIDNGARAEFLGVPKETAEKIALVSGALSFAKNLIKSPVSRTGPLTYVGRAAQEKIVEAL